MSALLNYTIVMLKQFATILLDHIIANAVIIGKVMGLIAMTSMSALLNDTIVILKQFATILLGHIIANVVIIGSVMDETSARKVNNLLLFDSILWQY